MLSQLREIKEAHLAYVKSHEERLEARLKEAKKHQKIALEKIERLEREIAAVLLEQQASTEKISDEES